MHESPANKLIERLDSLIRDVKDVDTIKQKYGHVRYKPFFATYNSCIDEFKSLFPEEHAKLNLEDLPLYDSEGQEQFTNTKISTLLHQSNDVIAVLRTFTTAKSVQARYPNKVTLYWLWRHVPVKFWICMASLLIGAFLIGVRVGQISWIQELINKK